MTGNQRLRAGVMALAIVVGTATVVGGLLLGGSPLTVIGAALAVASLALAGARLAGEIGGARGSRPIERPGLGRRHAWLFASLGVGLLIQPIAFVTLRSGLGVERDVALYVAIAVGGLVAGALMFLSGRATM